MVGCRAIPAKMPLYEPNSRCYNHYISEAKRGAVIMRQKATLAVLGAGSLWGIISIFIRNLNAAGLTALQIGAMRNVLAAAVIFLWLGIADRSLLKIRLRDVWMFLGTGIVSMAIFNWCYFTVIEISQASVAVVLLYTSPIFIMILSALLFREKITGRKILALVMTFAGCVLVAGLLGGSYTLSPLVILLGLGSGLFYGLYTIFGSVALRRYDTRTVTAYTFLFATVGSLPLCRPAEGVRALAAHPTGLLWCLGMALVSTMAPYLLYTWGLAHMSNGRAAILVTVEPMVGALLGILAYHEPANPAKLLGMALIFGAVILLNLSGGREEAAAPSNHMER